MTLRFDFFYENADKEYFLALLQKLANACNVDLRAESSAEFVSIFASAESSEILGKFVDILQAEVPHSLYFKLKEVNLCNEARGEKIALNARSDIFSVSDINAIKDIQNPRFCEIYADSANSASCGDFSRSRSPHFLDEPFVLSASLTSHECKNSSTILEFASCNNAESALDSALLKSTLQNLCDALAKGQSVALNTGRGEILLSTKSKDFDFILANDIATLHLYTRATQDEISALASFEKPLIELAIKEVFVREVGAKSAKFILPFDIILCCLSSMLLEKDIAFVRAKFAESSAESSAFFEIVVGQNGYFLHKNYLDSADFAEFLNINFGTQSCAKNSVIASEQDERGNPQIMIYLSLQNPSIFACAGRKIANIAFDKNPKNILQKISHLENGDKLIANFKKAFEARYEAIQRLDSAPQWTQNLLDIFECAAMILGAESKNAESSKNEILNLAKEYLRDIGPKIDFKSIKTINNNLCEAPLISPASWCKKSESKGAEVPPADFLLEADKRGSPPKSEKRSFWRVGGAGRGVQPFCEKESSNISGNENAESVKESQGGLPRRFCESARNDENLDSSLRKCFAQNDKIMDCYADSANLLAMTKDKNFAESTLDSAISTQEANSSIVDEFSRFCEASDADRTNGSSRKRGELERETTPQDAEFVFYDELRTIRSIISFTLAGSEPEVIAFGIIESLADYLVLLFREAQNQFGAKNIAIAGDLFANKVFFDKITKKIPTDFKLIFPKYLDISSARRASCKT